MSVTDSDICTIWWLQLVATDLHFGVCSYLRKIYCYMSAAGSDSGTICCLQLVATDVRFLFAAGKAICIIWCLQLVTNIVLFDVCRW